MRLATVRRLLEVINGYWNGDSFGASYPSWVDWFALLGNHDSGVKGMIELLAIVAVVAVLAVIADRYEDG